MRPIVSILIICAVAGVILPFSTQITAQQAPQISICGDGHAEYGKGLPPGTYGLVDRFNHPWKPSEQLVKAQREGTAGIQGADGCSRFRIDFEDVILGNGIGFDDRTEIDHPILGRTTRGALRRRTLCEVFAYVESLIDMKGDPDIIVRASQTDGGGFLAAAGPFFLNGGSGYDGGTLFDHITTGNDPTPAPGNYDGTIIFDFGYSYYEDWSTSPGNMIDLYSVTLHEATHALGFLSLIRPDGSSGIGGAFSLFDKRLHEANGTPMINPVTNAFQSSPAAILSNGLNYHGELCGDPSPVYSPDPYRSGSSLSHFDSYRSGIRYVMRPSTGGGEDRRYTMEEMQVLCELGYTLRGGFCNGCAPRGVDDFANTLQGVEVCIDVTANDINHDGGPTGIDPASVRIITGGGSFRIQGNELCYTPSLGFVGLAVLQYAPANIAGPGSEAKVFVNVAPAVPPPPARRKDYMLWYFGSYAGLSFGSGAPVPVTDGALETDEGCATICDPVSGELLFYTNGVTVWDRTHAPMPNGTGLLGQNSTTQSAVIVPMPNDSTRFYVFTANTPFTNAEGKEIYFGLRYSVVDMRLNGGNGDVTEKNVMLIPYGTEKLAATRHCNGRDFWVLSHEIGSNNFLAYPVTPDGVGAPVVSSIGHVYEFFLDSAYAARSGIGYLKVSPDGKRVATASTHVFDVDEYWGSSIDAFDFDNATGRLSNHIRLDYRRQGFYYGLSFSPDNTKLYASRYKLGDAMFQWDLSAGDATAISASRTTLPLGEQLQLTALQLGPDGRLYISPNGQEYLGVITEPNKKGIACNLVTHGVHLGGKTARYGLPNLIDFDLFNTIDVASKLRLTKVLNDEQPRYNDTISYTIRVCNERICGDAYDVTVEDVLPDGLDYVEGFSDYPLHRFDTIAAGECREVIIRAVVGNRLPLATPITNCARLVDGNPAQQIPGENCATFVLNGLDLGIVKSVDKDSVDPGEGMEFIIAVTNYGRISAESVVVRDLIPAGLTYLSHTISDPTATYNPADGTLAIPEIDPGKSVELRLRCTAEDAAWGTITNCAEIVDLKQSELDLTNNRSCASIFVRSIDLDLAKSVSPERPLPGGEITYTITATNKGEIAAREIAVTEALPADLIYVTHTLSDPTADYDPATGLLTIPLLPPGKSVVMIITCRLPETGSAEKITNCVAVAGMEGSDREPANDRACIDIYPRWCITPELTVPASIPQNLSAPIDKSFIAPLLLEESLAGEPIPRIRISATYDPAILILENWNDESSLTKGTLLEGWKLASATNAGGVYQAEFTPPTATGSIDATGRLLNLSYRMFLGKEYTSEIIPSVTIPGNPCVEIIAQPGRATIDSLCGLNLRLIELTAIKYAVQGARPNPFSHSTEIFFSLGMDGETSVRIYDLSGHVVATLVESYLAPGTYSVTWNAEGYPPGVYFYRLTSGAWTNQGELLLTR